MFGVSPRMPEYIDPAVLGLTRVGDLIPEGGGYKVSVVPMGGGGGEGPCGIGKARRGFTGGGGAEMMGTGGASCSGGVSCLLEAEMASSFEMRWSANENVDSSIICSLGCSRRISSSK